MTYNQYYNLLQFSYLFYFTNYYNHVDDYYLEKIQLFLGDIEVSNVKKNKYSNSKDERVHAILNFLENFNHKYNVNDRIRIYLKHIDNKIPENIIQGGIHEMVKKAIDSHLHFHKKEIIILKRKSILKKLIKK